MADDDAGQAGSRDPRDAHSRHREMRHVPDRRHGRRQVRVVGEHRFAAARARAADGPVVTDRAVFHVKPDARKRARHRLARC